MSINHTKNASCEFSYKDTLRQLQIELVKLQKTICSPELIFVLHHGQSSEPTTKNMFASM
jgi:hypothetical protein